MPTWGEILEELKRTIIPGQRPIPKFDSVRRKYLGLLYKYTNRNVILYATSWSQPGSPQNLVSITEEDIEGFMEVVHGLNSDGLDLILHSPGGSPDVTGALVDYLRTKFADIRVIIPQSAMSAATMLACSANRIMMGKHSFIGPIDPQLVINTQLGLQMMPAQAILDQFDMARKECKDPRNLGHWLPILSQYGPALLKQCENANALSKRLVGEWLERYMFAGSKDALTNANKIADYLSDHKTHKSHGVHFPRQKAKEIGLIVDDLEEDQQLQDLILSVFHATTHTFAGTSAVKIIENHLGKAFLRINQSVQIPFPIANIPIQPKK